MYNKVVFCQQIDGDINTSTAAYFILLEWKLVRHLNIVKIYNDSDIFSTYNVL